MTTAKRAQQSCGVRDIVKLIEEWEAQGSGGIWTAQN